MKKLLYLGCLLLFAFALVACSEKTVKGSRNIVTQDRQVEPFKRVKAIGGLSLIIDVGQPQRVSVIADDNLQSHILTQIKEGTLEISTQKGFLLVPSKPIRIQINASELVSLSTSGATQTEVTGLNGHSFDVASTGEAKLVLAGKTDNASYAMSGAAQLDARNLQAEAVSLDMTSEAKAEVYASKKLSVKISGEGNVTYYGSPPIVDQAVFGSGKIQRAGQ